MLLFLAMILRLPSNPANNPDLGTLVQNLRADQAVNQKEKEILFKDL